MSDAKNRPEEKHIRVVLSRFIMQNRIGFLILLGIIVITLVGVGVYTNVHQKNIEKSSVAAENLQDLYDDWKSAEESDKESLKTQLISEAEDTLKSYRNLYAAQRARMVLGQLYYESGEWQNSIEQFNHLAEDFSSSYLAPVAIMSSAAAYEQLDDPESAIAAYESVHEKYGDSFPLVAYALISSGRLYESLNDTESAIETYNTVIDNFSGSNWTNIAHDRIIYLETVN